MPVVCSLWKPSLGLLLQRMPQSKGVSTVRVKALLFLGQLTNHHIVTETRAQEEPLAERRKHF
ncbi:MAG: hypothetical protein HXS41_09840 [Theionarchaea archaeon]|nr:hypothetical protein [Theionarchaea archaeon]